MAGPGASQLGCGAGDSDAGADGSLRSGGGLAGEFLPCGGSAGAALLLGLADDEYAGAELSCAGGVWEVAVRAMRASRAFGRKGRREQSQRTQRGAFERHCKSEAGHVVGGVRGGKSKILLRSF